MYRFLAIVIFITCLGFIALESGTVSISTGGSRYGWPLILASQKEEYFRQSYRPVEVHPEGIIFMGLISLVAGGTSVLFWRKFPTK